MTNVNARAVAATLRAEVVVLDTAFGNKQPTIRVILAACGRGDSRRISASASHRWIASATYLLAAATELECIGYNWAVVVDTNAGTVALELVVCADETVESARRCLHAVVNSTPLGQVFE
jgi:hypothetical protein